MDSDKKRRIRRISIPLFWIVEVFLFLSLVVALYVKYYEEELPEAMIGAQAIQELVMADEVLLNTQSRVSFQKEENLMRFLPPQDKTDLSQWAAQIKEHMDIECAVFLYDGKVMRWPVVPSQFQGRVAFVDSLVRTRVVNDTTGKIKLLGNFEMLTIYGGKGELPRAVAVGPVDSELRWGIIFNLSDSFWLSFARKLNKSRDLSFDQDLNEFRAVFDIKKSPQRPDTVASKSDFGLQLFTQSDSLLFETPGIDTSFHKFQQRHDEIPVYSIVYLPRWSEEFLRMVKERFTEEFTFPAYKIAVLVLIMFVLALFYHWIDKLTRPE